VATPVDGLATGIAVCGCGAYDYNGPTVTGGPYSTTRVRPSPLAASDISRPVRSTESWSVGSRPSFSILDDTNLSITIPARAPVAFDPVYISTPYETRMFSLQVTS
jgi:hypothetical protein